MRQHQVRTGILQTLLDDVLRVSCVAECSRQDHVHRDPQAVLVRQLPRPLGQELFLAGVECLLSFGENVVDLEPGKLVFEQTALDSIRVVVGADHHQAARFRPRLKFVGEKLVRGFAVQSLDGKRKVQPVGNQSVAHPASHAGGHRFVTDGRFRCEPAVFGVQDMAQFVPMSVRVERVGRNEIADRGIEQRKIGVGDLEASGVGEVDPCHGLPRRLDVRVSHIKSCLSSWFGRLRQPDFWEVGNRTGSLCCGCSECYRVTSIDARSIGFHHIHSREAASPCNLGRSCFRTSSR